MKNDKSIQKDIPVRTVMLQDTFKVVLRNNFAGGYEWEYVPNEKLVLISAQDSSLVLEGIDKPDYNRTFLISPVKVGKTTLYFHKKRPFEPDSLKQLNQHSEVIIIKAKGKKLQ